MDMAYPPCNFKRQKKGTKINYNAQNKQMFGVEYNKLSEEIILASLKNIRTLLREYLGIKSFMLRIPKYETSSASMGKYKQICMTHLAMAECVYHPSN